VTPGTSQGATLKEKARPDTRTIMHRKAAYIENNGFHRKKIGKCVVDEAVVGSTHPAGKKAFAVIVV